MADRKDGQAPGTHVFYIIKYNLRFLKKARKMTQTQHNYQINFDEQIEEIINKITKSNKKPNLDWYDNKFTIKLSKPKNIKKCHS